MGARRVRELGLRVLVYERGPGEPERRVAVPELEWVDLDAASIGALFGAEPERRAAFERLRGEGHRGVAAVDGEGWMTYGWLATGRSGPPSHLPAWAGRSPWIFHCATRESARGRGCYRAALVRLDALASRVAPEAPLFVDTAPGNVPARRAILRAGFRPAGQALAVRVPRTGRVLGVWWRGARHPGLTVRARHT